MIGMGSENYELIDKLESIAKSLESLAESQKKIAEALVWIVKDKEVIY
ncbi:MULTISPECIES: hypothetical protein [Methanosarcina]|uniref:Uncharacterized protein n=1 Tax=Methanosarcina barkeri CM1 TaxID=796385 RepID=A0A0G3CN13_METBA|nr:MULTISPECIES: hypothetical protein [Methanosarcina]AKJ40512.1 hypothetical protein MCM1_3529 [Methanosarcina barkeri CM1]